MKFAPNSKAFKIYKSQLGSLSKIEFETAVGLLLGDVSIQSQNKGKTHRLKGVISIKNMHSMFISYLINGY